MNTLKKNKHSVTYRMLTIIVLLIIFLPITALVHGLIEERADRQVETATEISSKWGQKQIITGPILSIPFTGNNNAYFAPENLKITGEVTSEIRSRGIYDIPVYEANLTLNGTFNHPNLSKIDQIVRSPQFDKARINIGIPDLKGVAENIEFKWNNQNLEVSPGITGLSDKGVHAQTVIDTENPRNYDFEIKIKLRGSQALYLLPAGKETTVAIDSDWPTPSFAGSFLPTNHDISDTGFTADWKVLDLNRGLPQQWTNTNSIKIPKFGNIEYDFSDEHLIGIKFIQTIDIYQKVTRSAKYAIAVIALVFMIFFLVEIIAKKRIHPFQYGLVGFGLVIYYTLLLSLAEYIAFGFAYVIASVALIGLTTMYSRSATKSTKLGLVTGGMLTILYSFIFLLLRSQDITLLIGSFGLFIILAVVMYITRNIDWYKEEQV